MIKDLTRLSEKWRSSGEMVGVCEEITRFFIMAVDEGRKKYSNQLEFDEKSNRESLTKVMTPLIEIYTEAKMKLYKLIQQMKEEKQ